MLFQTQPRVTEILGKLELPSTSARLAVEPVAWILVTPSSQGRNVRFGDLKKKWSQVTELTSDT